MTNAPRANAELVLSLLGLTSFFPVLVIGSECERAKPSPDPYLKALDLIGASPDHTFIFEVIKIRCSSVHAPLPTCHDVDECTSILVC